MLKTADVQIGSQLLHAANLISRPEYQEKTNWPSMWIKQQGFLLLPFLSRCLCSLLAPKRRLPIRCAAHVARLCRKSRSHWRQFAANIFKQALTTQPHFPFPGIQSFFTLLLFQACQFVFHICNGFSCAWGESEARRDEHTDFITLLLTLTESFVKSTQQFSTAGGGFLVGLNSRHEPFGRICSCFCCLQ